MTRSAICILFFLNAVTWSQGQAAANPFEILPRLPKEVLAADGLVRAGTNPFDVAPHRAPTAATALATNQTEAFNPFAVLPRGGSLPKGVLFGVLLTVLGILTFSVAANRGAVGKAWRGFLSDNALTVAQREASGLVGSTPYYLLYLNFLLNVGIFIFLVTHFFTNEHFNNLPFLLLCMVGGAGIFLFKHLMLAALRWLFPVEAEVRRYNFLILIFNCVLGLFLVPFNFLIAFSQDANYEALLVFWVLGLVGIFYAYRGLRASSIGSKILASDQFHFLLYLCCVEIAPVLFLVKLAMMQTN
jgi:hypothetical protein